MPVLQVVRAGAAYENVVSRVAFGVVITLVAEKYVVPVAAEKLIVALESPNRVVVRGPLEDIVIGGRRKGRRAAREVRPRPHRAVGELDAIDPAARARE